MAEPLKNQFGPATPRVLAEAIGRVYRAFKGEAFVGEVLEGFEPLDLMARGRRIARVLRRYLPENYGEAVGILMGSMGPKLEVTEGAGMAPFFYLPHTFFIAEYGLEDFEISMRAQYEVTQRFTAEYCIRPFLERHTEKTLARLGEWAGDPSVHVRRLVSEGTRPRLPWAPRLREFQKDPSPVLAVLEKLKDDPELYVRRSVANNLNDIGKDHPKLLVETARRWWRGASEERRWLVRHALRSAVKRGEAGVLEVLGFGREVRVEIWKASLAPGKVRVGETVTIAFDARNAGAKAERLLVDFRIYFVKAGGKVRPKVFKLKTILLDPGQSVRLSKRVSLAEMTTRKHYPGPHRVEVLVNGAATAIGAFEVGPAYPNERSKGD